MMATTEERMKILKMIDEGKISAEEGAKLLSALSESRSRSMGGSSLSRGVGNARWLRVKVTDVASGRSKATVQIPIGLLDAGLKIGAHFAPEVEGVDLTQLMEAVRSGVTGKLVDVIDDEDGEHVEIYVE
jgi:carbohydrate-binding DOMON domain-containing protein